MTRFGPLVPRFVAIGLLALVSVAVVSAIVVLPTSYINSLKERRADALFQLPLDVTHSSGSDADAQVMVFEFPIISEAVARKIPDRPVVVDAV